MYAPTKKKKLDLPYLCGVTFTIAAFLFDFVAFVSPYWIIVRPEYATGSQFIRLGLWVTCFDKYVHPEDYVSKDYSGCWYVYYPEYNYIRDWLNPAWFYAVQMLSLVALFCHIGAILIVGLKACKIILKNHVKSDRFVIILHLVASFCFTIMVVLMGVMSKDRQWMPRPDHNQVSWAFAFAVLAGFFSAFAFIFFSLRFLRVHCQESIWVGLGCVKSSEDARALDPRSDDTKNSTAADNDGMTTSAAAAAAKHRDAFNRGDLDAAKWEPDVVGVPAPDYIGYYRGTHGSFTNYTDTLV